MLLQLIDRIGIHGIFKLIARLLHALHAKQRMLFDGQRIQREMLKRQLEHLMQISLPLLHILIGQAIDEIGRDVDDPRFDQITHASADHRGVMSALHPLQQRGIKALHAQRDAVHAMPADDGDLFCAERFRIGFHGVFLELRAVRIKDLQQLFELITVQGRRGPSADIQRLQRLLQLSGSFFPQTAEPARAQLRAIAPAGEIAVSADRCAKRNVDIGAGNHDHHPFRRRP